MKKVLQLTTYDIDDADHGGKLRCLNFRNALSKDFNVKTMSIEVSDIESINDFKYKLDKEKFDLIGGNKYLIDVYINRYIEEYAYLLTDIKEKFDSFDPDIIIFEQPYLWPVFENFINEKRNRFIINSTQNIEVELKREIYSTRFEARQANSLICEVENVEASLANCSNVSISVSEKDCSYVRSINPSISSYVYGNGSSIPKENGCSNKWKKRFSEIAKYNLVFVGSAHPPNIDGLKALINACNDLGGEFYCQLWILGGVAEFIRDDKEMSKMLPSWVRVLGSQSASDIDAAILASDGVILPIWHGGGSNLKTAQAILSGKFILASDYAFRGFEKFKVRSNTKVFETPKDVAKWLKNTETLSHKNGTVTDAEIDELSWEGVLRKLPLVLKKEYEKWNLK